MIVTCGRCFVPVDIAPDEEFVMCPSCVAAEAKSVAANIRAFNAPLSPERMLRLANEEIATLRARLADAQMVAGRIAAAEKVIDAARNVRRELDDPRHFEKCDSRVAAVLRRALAAYDGEVQR
jgi:hypothetical protein